MSGNGLANERGFPVLGEPRTVRVAVYGNKEPRWRGATFHQLTQGGEIMSIVTVGIDLAKNVSDRLVELADH